MKVLTGSNKGMSKRIVPVLIMAVMIMSLAGMAIIGMAGQVSAQDPSTTPMVAHGPIVAHNNTEMADLMAVNDWPGDGSSSHPYLIGNLVINATGFTNAISIGNTSSYIIITNSHITNASSVSAGFGYGAGISLFNTSNVRSSTTPSAIADTASS